MAPLTFDEALTRHVGQFGPGQWRILSSSSLCLIANAAAFFFWTLAAGNPVLGHAWECVQPRDSACQAVKQQEAPSKQDFCALPAGSTRWTKQDCLVARFNLVCTDAWKVQFTNSLMFMGAFLGSGLFGVLCDRWGRRRPLFLATSLMAVSMFASLAAPSFWVFAVLRAVTGLGAAGQSHCNFLISTEPVGPSFRGLAGLCTLFFWVVGEFVIVGLGFSLPAWQHLLIACSAINAASLLLYPLVPESGRWLLSKGRTEEARQFLERVARGNGSHVPPERLTSSHSSKQLAMAASARDVEAACAPAVVGRLEAGGSQDRSTSSAGDTGEVPAGCPQAAEAPVDLGQLLRRPRLAHRLAILLVNSFTLTGNFYGISMAAGGIPGSIYMTFAIGVAAEAFAAIIVAPSVDRFGRHNIVSLGQLVGGVACIACANVSGGKQQAALAAIGKFGCSAASSVNPIYIAELLPTSCRSSVMGICSQASRVGSVAAPFLLMLGTQLVLPGRSQVFIPFMAFGCLAILSGLLIMTMPETLGAAMPENVADLENLLSVFAAKPWRNGLSSLVAFVFRTRARGLSRRASADAASACGSSSSAVSSTGSSCSVDAEAHVGVDIAGVTVIVRQRPPGGLQKQMGREGSQDDADQTK